MSYYQKVLQNNPAGFWPLENGYVTKDVSAGTWQSGVRTRNNIVLSNSSSVFYKDTFPLIMSGTNAYKFSSTNSIKINNVYDIFYRGTERKTFTIELWIAFDTIPQNDQIITIKNDSTTVGYVNFNDNYASWTMWDSNNNAYTAKALVNSYESQIYLVLSYSDRTISLTVNGVNTGKSRLPESSQFANIITSPPYFQFGPKINNQFIVDNIAFYTRTLGQREMEERYAWAKNEKNTSTYTLKNKGGIIDFHENMGTVQDYLLFNDRRTWSGGMTNNLVIENDALRTKFITAPEPYNNKGVATLSYLQASSKTGLVTTGYNSVRINNFEDLFNINDQAITCQVYFDINNTSRMCYYSISGFSCGAINLEHTVDKKIRLYSFENFSEIDMSYTPTSSGWYDIKVYFIGNTIYFQVNQQTVNSTAYSSNISIGNLTVSLGNCYEDSTTSFPTTLPVANFGLFSKSDVISTPTLDITQKSNLLLTLNATLSISQYGYWKTFINLDTSSIIVGTRVDYDTASKNVLVEFSYDDITWYSLSQSGKQIPNLNLYEVKESMYIRISMNTPDSENVRLSMNYLEIATYSSLFVSSEGFGFTIEPVENINYTMLFKNNENNILSRDNNFGMYFQPETSVSEKPGSNLLTLAESTSTLEFLFRVDDALGGSFAYLIDSSDSANYIRYTPSTMALTFSGFNSVYINGFAVTSGKIIQSGETYHLMAVKNVAITSSTTLKINSKYDNTLHAHATYGKLCAYSDAKNSEFARGKYLRSLGINKNRVIDTFTGSIVDAAAVYDEPDAILTV